MLAGGLEGVDAGARPTLLLIISVIVSCTQKPPFARTLRAVVLELVLLASAKIALPAISSSLIPGPHASATGASASDPGVSTAHAPEHVLHTAWSAVVHACGGCALLFALLTVSPHHQPPKRGQVKDPCSSSVGGDVRETQKPGGCSGRCALVQLPPHKLCNASRCVQLRAPAKLCYAKVH